MIKDQPKLPQVTADFESTVRGAFRKVLPKVQLLGCAFHWNQALWRKVQELGLQTAYTSDQATNKYIRQLMALPFSPHEITEATYESLKAEATLEKTWIRSRVWPSKCWSVFMQSIRKNNDIEGWNHGLNKTAADRCGLALYLLHKEARLVSLQIRLVSESKLKRMQRATYCQMQSGPSDMWEVFNNKQN